MASLTYLSSGSVWCLLVATIIALSISCGSQREQSITTSELTRNPSNEVNVPLSIVNLGTHSTENDELPAGDQGSMDKLNPAYTNLETVVPPCIPFHGSEVDPCERRIGWRDNNPFIETAIQIPDIISSYKENLIERASVPFWATHFVVRATVIPNSTRCAWSDIHRDHYKEYTARALRVTRDGQSYCYYDLAVNEYLHGSGPTRLTVNFQTKAWGGLSPCDSQCLAEGAQYIEDVSGFEGREWIVKIGGPGDLGTGAWTTLGFDDVQRREDGEIVVVSFLKQFLDPNTDPINWSRVEWTLENFRVVVSDVYKSFKTLTGGRTGNVRDRLGRLPPFFAEDAGPDGFKNFITSTKMLDGLDITPSPPPPVPGEGDPDPSGLTTNDIIATRVAGGVKVPGGLTDFETPVPTLGDEPTATATTEPTATATTVTEVIDTPAAEPTATATTVTEVADTPTPEPTATVEPTVTPEPAPTPEPTLEPTATATPEPAPTPEPADTPTPESEVPIGPGAEETPADPIDPGTGGNGEPGAGPGA